MSESVRGRAGRVCGDFMAWGREGGHTSALCVSWVASWKAVAARSCSCPAVAMLLSNVAVAAVRTCSWALERGADSMVVVVVVAAVLWWARAGHGRGVVGAGGALKTRRVEDGRWHDGWLQAGDPTPCPPITRWERHYYCTQ